MFALDRAAAPYAVFVSWQAQKLTLFVPGFRKHTYNVLLVQDKLCKRYRRNNTVVIIAPSIPEVGLPG